MQTLYSKRFEDVYHSRQNGLGETEHVFLKGNTLPDKWQKRERFSICELGFGTGLNFMATADLFEKTSSRNCRLHYISIEKYPLDIHTIRKVLNPLFGDKTRPLIRHYPLRIAGFHRIDFSGNINLTLVFDDVREALPELSGPIDCWYLDGFTPALNPEMWHEEIFSHMASLSTPGTTFATYTAAGHVRRNLVQAGFHVEKTKGYARKREMLQGFYEGPLRRVSTSRIKHPESVAILGAGLAGTMTAHALKKRGINPLLIDSSPCPPGGSSGNPSGMVNPRPFAQRGGQAEYFSTAFALAHRIYKNLAREHDIGFRACGALHLCIDDKKAVRFGKALKNMGWHCETMRLVSAGTASELAGIDLKNMAMWFPDAFMLSPQKLVTTLLGNHGNHRFGHNITQILKKGGIWRLIDDTGKTVTEASVIILSNALDAARLYPGLSSDSLQPLAGHITFLKNGGPFEKLKSNIIYGGHVCPPVNGFAQLGASFYRHTKTVPTPFSMENVYRFENFFGKKINPALVSHHWSSYRVTTPDRLPCIGPDEEREGLFICTGFGSHGLMGAALGGEVIADYLTEDSGTTSLSLLNLVKPNRYRCKG